MLFTCRIITKSQQFSCWFRDDYLTSLPVENPWRSTHFAHSFLSLDWITHWLTQVRRINNSYTRNKLRLFFFRNSSFSLCCFFERFIVSRKTSRRTEEKKSHGTFLWLIFYAVVFSRWRQPAKPSHRPSQSHRRLLLSIYFSVKSIRKMFTNSLTCNNACRNDELSSMTCISGLLIRLEHLDKSNERLDGLNRLSAQRYSEAAKQFEKHTHMLTTMKTDLDTIFKRIK